MPNRVEGGLFKERLLKHTQLMDDHWLFIGSLTPAGYGRIKIKGKKYSIIRLSLMLYLSLDYDDWTWQANHKDDICKHKNCWNPQHLYKGTHSENMFDAVKSGTHGKTRRINCKLGHLIDGKKKNGQRFCLTCKRACDRAYQRKISNA